MDADLLTVAGLQGITSMTMDEAVRHAGAVLDRPDFDIATVRWIQQLRELVSAYAAANAQHGAGSDGAEKLCSGPDWDHLVQQCRTIVAAERMEPPVPRVQLTPETNTLNLDTNNHFFHTMDQGRAEVFTLDELFNLQEINSPHHGGGGHGDFAEDAFGDPAYELHCRLQRFGEKHAAHLPSCPSVAATPGAARDASLASMSPPGNDTQSLDGSACIECDDTTEEIIAFLQGLLDCRGEVAWQYHDWALLVRVIAHGAALHPEDGLTLAERFFAGAEARRRYLLLSLLVGEVPKEHKWAPEMQHRFLSVVLHMADELPGDWVTLLDEEIEDLLRRFLRGVIMPHITTFSALDPCAAWLGRWCERPSLAAVIQRLSTAADDIMERLHSAVAVWEPHAASIVTYLVGFLVDHEHGLPEEPSRILARTLFVWLRQLRPPTGGASQPAPAAFDEVGERVIGAVRVCTWSLPLRLWEEALRSCAKTFVRLAGSSNTASSVEGMASSLQVLHALLVGVEPPHGGSKRLKERMSAVGEVLTTMTATIAARAASPKRKKRAAERSDASSSAWFAFLEGVLALYGHGCAKVLSGLVDMATSGESEHRADYVSVLVGASVDAAAWLEIRLALLACKRGIGAAALVTAIFRVGARMDRRFGDFNAKDSTVSSETAVLTPLTWVLLMRWCTLEAVREAIRKELAVRLQQIADPLFLPADRVGDWPLLVPVELLDGIDGGGGYLGGDLFAPSAIELPAAARAELLTCATLQAARLLADIAGDALGSGPLPREDALIIRLTRQLDEVFLPQEASGTANDDEHRSAPGVTFGDDSLLVLLSTATLCVLASSRVEEWLWRSSAAVTERHAHLRRLRELCQARRGVDPVYFLVRFLTSGGKGRKRLGSVLMDGFQAELQVDTKIPVESFVEGEEYPRLCAGGPMEDGGRNKEVMQLVTTAFGKEAVRCSEEQLRRCALGLSQLYTGPDADTELVRAFGRRPVGDWVAFATAPLRAKAVVQRILALEQHRTGDTGDSFEAGDGPILGLLAAAGVDIHFLVGMCVSSWMWLPPLKDPAKNGLGSSGLLKSSLREFMKRGLDAWDELVARSLRAFIHTCTQEVDELGWVSGERRLPAACPYPNLSPLFTLLLVKPFSLAKPKSA